MTLLACRWTLCLCFIKSWGICDWPIRYLPSIYQCVLTSATLNQDVENLKRLVLHQPGILKLEEPELPPSSQLTQYQIFAEEEDKAVLIYALFKLNLVRGKTIVFVRNVDRCYKSVPFPSPIKLPLLILSFFQFVLTWHWIDLAEIVFKLCIIHFVFLL